jgi:copper transport protein
MTTNKRPAPNSFHLVVVGLLFSLVVWLAFPASTLAHAEFLRSDPVSGAALSSPPAQIDIWFSEKVAPGVSTIRVYDRERRQVETKTSVVDPNDARHLSVDLPSLDPGVYTVVWANVSSDDGHPDKGGFAFTVLAPAGSSVPSAAPTEVTTSTTDLVGAQSDSLAQGVNLIASWLAILAFVLAGGGALFLLICLAPALRQPGEAGAAFWTTMTRRFALIALAVAGIGAIAALASLLAKANIVTGQSIGHILSSGVLGAMLAPWSGRVWIAREVAFVAILVVALGWLLRTRCGGVEQPGKSGSGALAVIALLGAAGLAFQALDSHLAAGHVARHGPLGTVALALHLVAAGAWVGGLGVGALLLLPIWRGLDGELRRAISTNVIARFSTLALTSVVIIGLSGLYVAVLMLPSASDLLSSTYGQALDLKIVLFLVLILIGALNRKTLAGLAAAAPAALQEAANRAGDRLLKAMRREFVIAGVIVLAAAIMLSVGPPSVALRFGTTNLTTTVSLPPAIPSAASPAASAGPESTLYHSEAKAGDLSVTLNVDPAVAGASNTFTVTVNGANGTPISGAEVKLWLTAKAFDMGTQTLKAEPAGPGVYRVQSPALAAPGEWDTQVVIRRDNVPEEQIAFTIPAAEPMANASTAASSSVTSLRAELSLSPATPSVGRFNTVRLHLTDQSGKPVDGVQASATWDMVQMGHELHTDLLPVPGEPGTYETRVNFIMQGGWSGTVDLTLPDGRKGQPAFSLNVEPRAGSASGAFPVLAVLNGKTLLALVAIAGAVGAFLISRGSKGRGLERALGVVIALVLLAVGLGAGWVSVNDAYRQQVVNPVPATAESIAKGSSVYSANCAVCHGTDARGDGPMAQTLNPPPSDLTVHITQHPDADLFDFVSNGIQGSAMPAFKDRLSEEERWNVLNYLKSVAAKK